MKTSSTSPFGSARNKPGELGRRSSKTARICGMTNSAAPTHSCQLAPTTMYAKKTKMPVRSARRRETLHGAGLGQVAGLGDVQPPRVQVRRDRLERRAGRRAPPGRSTRRCSACSAIGSSRAGQPGQREDDLLHGPRADERGDDEVRRALPGLLEAARRRAPQRASRARQHRDDEPQRAEAEHEPQVGAGVHAPEREHAGREDQHGDEAGGRVEDAEQGDRDRQGGGRGERLAAGVAERRDAEREAGERRQQRRRAEDRAQVRAVGGDAREQRRPPRQARGQRGAERVDRLRPRPAPRPRPVAERDRAESGAEELDVHALVVEARLGRTRPPLALGAGRRREPLRRRAADAAATAGEREPAGGSCRAASA